jgi:hypothetical protein
VNNSDKDIAVNLRLVFDHGEPLFDLDGNRGVYLFLDDQVGEEIPVQGDPYDQTDRYYSYLVLGLRKEKISYPIHGKIGDVAWGGNGLIKAQVEPFVSDINRLVSENKETSLSHIVCPFCLQEGYVDQSHDPLRQFRECVDVSNSELRYKRA